MKIKIFLGEANLQVFRILLNFEKAFPAVVEEQI